MRICDGDCEISASRDHLIFAYYVTGHGFGHATRVVEVQQFLFLFFFFSKVSWNFRVNCEIIRWISCKLINIFRLLMIQA